jgi:hypothetical protein
MESGVPGGTVHKLLYYCTGPLAHWANAAPASNGAMTKDGCGKAFEDDWCFEAEQLYGDRGSTPKDPGCRIAVLLSPIDTHSESE